jgi:hypothetical protein
LYVDDIIINGHDITGIHELKEFLSQEFEMKDLGPLNYLVSLEIFSSFDCYYLTHAKYTFDLLSRANLTESKIADISIVFNACLNPQDGEPFCDHTLYRH